MQKIYCNVNSCSHNKSSVCFSNRINIVGKNSNADYETSCSSFLDKAVYSNLTNNVYSQGDPCNCLVCQVNTCKHNQNHLCSLNSVNIAGNNVNFYNHTNCESFLKR